MRCFGSLLSAAIIITGQALAEEAPGDAAG